MRKKGEKISLYVTTLKQSELLLSQSLLTATKVYSAKMEMQKKHLVSRGDCVCNLSLKQKKS